LVFSLFIIHYSLFIIHYSLPLARYSDNRLINFTVGKSR
jgi:hypothetical protein